MKRSLIIITLLSIIAGACSKNNDTASAPLSYADSVRIADSIRVADSVRYQDSLARIVYDFDFTGTLHDKTYSDNTPEYELDTDLVTSIHVTIMGNLVTFSLPYFSHDPSTGKFLFTSTGPLQTVLRKGDTFNVAHSSTGGFLLNNRHGLRAHYSTYQGCCIGIIADFVGTR